MISIFTSMTNPSDRKDPWEEALKCYGNFADEVVVVGDDWPEEFNWDLIGKTFQQGFDKSNGDWVLWMDLDNFIHEKDYSYIKTILKKSTDFPAVAFPMHQIFTPDRYQLKTIKCLALNKRKFPNILLNGGGDLCLPTLEGSLIYPESVPISKRPIWNYDTVFRTKDIIRKDRLRFANAWFRYFNDWGDRGGPSETEAYEAWFSMVKERYAKHYFRLKIEDHPRVIQDKLLNLDSTQFGHNAFGLKDNIKVSPISKLKEIKNKLTYEI